MSDDKPTKHARITKKHSADQADYDYLNKLSAEEAAFLRTFSDEYYQGYFRKGVEPVHKDKEARRKCYTANNASRRDVWNTSWRTPGDLTEFLPDEGDD